MKYLLDTCVISELVRKQPQQHVIGWIDRVDAAYLYLSVVTIGEIRKGIEKLADSRRKTELLAWLQHDLLIRFRSTILPLDVETMLVWGTMNGQLARQGTPLPAIDSLLAALAVRYDLTLVTRNIADFKAAPITLFNPWENEK